MLHFFRKIRRNLITSNKTSKYLQYAIGEIVLVVLGILIALYINNQNDQRKERERFDQVLAEVEKELEANISETRTYISWFAITDSLFLKVLIDSLDIDNYNGVQGNRLRTLAYTYSFAILKDDSFKKLSQSNNLTLEQEQLFNELSDLNNSIERIEERRKYMIEGHKKNLTTIKKYDWFRNMVFSADDKTANDYYLNDPEHYNSSTEYFILTSDYSRALMGYDKKAVRVYEKIYKYLDGLGIRHSDSLLFQYDHQDYKHYMGKYNSQWCSKNWVVHDDSISISLEEGKFMFTGHKSDGPDRRFEIIPINKYHFTATDGYFHLSLDDSGEVKSMRFSQGPGFILTMEKTR